MAIIKLRNRARRILMTLLMAQPLLCWCTAGAWAEFQCKAVTNFRPNAAELDLLKLIRAKEELARVGSGLLAIAPVASCLANPVGCIISVSTTDWKNLAGPPSAIERIGIVAIRKEIDLYLIRPSSGEARTFFECLNSFYGSLLQ